MYRLRPCPCVGTTSTEYRRRDGGSRATDDLNRNKYGITDPPVSQLAP